MKLMADPFKKRNMKEMNKNIVELFIMNNTS